MKPVTGENGDEAPFPVPCGDDGQAAEEVWTGRGAFHGRKHKGCDACFCDRAGPSGDDALGCLPSPITFLPVVTNDKPR